MKWIKALGIVWGIAYFMIGAAKSFTLGGNDTWVSIALLFAVFLLPLPLSVSAAWFPKVSGKALLVCVAISFAAAAAFADATPLPVPAIYLVRFFGTLLLYNLPHLFFGVTYISTTRVFTGV
jgi:hypothetical protein